MTLNKIWKKLRKNNKDSYRQFCFCIGFAVLLITSYLMVLLSPMIQETLPQGGDSRKQVYMIFALAAAGCLIFITYAAGLFLRCKSREVGVFLALGTEKGRLKKALLKEIAICSGAMAGAGIASGSALSFLVGLVFEKLVKGISDASFAFTAAGFVSSILYALVVLAVVLILTVRFMKKSNIMDILNEQRKQEPLKKQVTFLYLVRGLVLLLGGFLMGFIIPGIVANMTGHYLGAWTNLFYLAALAGLYMVMVYSVSCHKRNRRPQKYYNNLITYSILKFQGRSIVRNMVVTTLLILAGLFAAFYVPMNSQAMNEVLSQYEAMYSMFYTENAKIPSREEIESMAEKHSLKIMNYRQARMLQVVGSGVNRDDLDEKGNLQEIYEKRHAAYEVFCASDYRKLTGQNVKIKDGSYYVIQNPQAKESLFDRFDDMDSLYLDKTGAYMPMKFAGKVTCQSLVRGRGFDNEYRFIVSDRDFEKIKKETDLLPQEIQVLFDSEKGENAEAFAEELYRSFGMRISDDMKVCSAYDAWQHLQQGETYAYADMAVYDPEHSIKESDWQYEPDFLVLKEANGLKTYAVYMLLFLYVAVVCLAAVWVISYARSQSACLACRQVLEDLAKLGAGKSYLKKILAKQVQKVFVLPALIGGFGALALGCLMLKSNDGVLSASEWSTIPFFALAAGVVMAVQYAVYRFSLGKAEKMMDL